MLILGVDLETTSLDVETCEVIEVGAVLWDWERKMPVRILSELVQPENGVPAEITALTGITLEDTHVYGVHHQTAMENLDSMLSEADYVMAHNGTIFDKPVYENWVDRESGYVVCDRPWLDTKTDIVYPSRVETRKLEFLAASHGFLNPFAHRAVFDVLTMLRIASQYDIQAIIARAAEPTIYVEAIVSFERKDMAKERGYKWFAPRKIWWKAFKESDLTIEREACGFMLRTLSGNPEGTHA
jgi:DNA polymerase III subunit epsilon